ncbi:Glyoxalase/Bleomycin resistance protein/Dihydroxybiphenyl dioxygenase [Lasiosphaeria ovina]|uniref:Glyoxalase/Bleomycin resistance protein/Dihydroxybiphenyl dioxygenase n=1 Tax=Lasiosphaeria ovina TaxID=92902 RepID=A0AAE0JX21_9PEZI|nr:Glyoxalase/Bleomycin resistance protein/Dihydroxybiphenyl dioxygenase [Lasiosphaeria ovina]
MSLGHVSLPTGPSHFKEMRDFYAATLKSIGYKVYMEKEGNFCGLQGYMGGPDFWLHCGGEDFAAGTATGKRGAGLAHVAFTVGSRKQVDQWYQSALKAGGTPNGEPGERDYAKGYYAAYVLDPLGNNIEAVYFNPWWMSVLNGAPKVFNLFVGVLVGNVVFMYGRKSGWWS